jgi:hypothetical protein
VRTPASGGFIKGQRVTCDNRAFMGDLTCLDEDVEFILHLECKKHKKWSIKDWLRQAEEDCPEGKIPVLVAHRELENSEPILRKNGQEKRMRVYDAKDFVTLPLDDFLRIVNRDRIVLEKTTKVRRNKK